MGWYSWLGWEEWNDSWEVSWEGYEVFVVFCVSECYGEGGGKVGVVWDRFVVRYCIYD